jgi:hypothetical protein
MPHSPLSGNTKIRYFFLFYSSSKLVDLQADLLVVYHAAGQPGDLSEVPDNLRKVLHDLKMGPCNL